MIRISLGVHAAAGLTRNDNPKKSYYAVSQLYDTLGDYRFKRVVKRQKGKVFVFEYEHAKLKEWIWVAWSPTGTRTDEKENHQPKEHRVQLENLPGRMEQVEGMQVRKKDLPKVDFKLSGSQLSLMVGESPIYIRFRK